MSPNFLDYHSLYEQCGSHSCGPFFHMSLAGSPWMKTAWKFLLRRLCHRYRAQGKTRSEKHKSGRAQCLHIDTILGIENHVYMALFWLQAQCVFLSLCVTAHRIPVCAKSMWSHMNHYAVWFMTGYLCNRGVLTNGFLSSGCLPNPELIFSNRWSFSRSNAGQQPCECLREGDVWDCCEQWRQAPLWKTIRKATVNMHS